MNWKFKHTVSYINWRFESRIVQLHHDEWNLIYNKFKDSGKRCKYMTVRDSWINMSYDIRKVGDYYQLYTFTEDDGYVIYNSNGYDDNKNCIIHKGKHAIQAVSDKFKELTGVGLRKAFGYSPEEFKNCIPKQFSYVNDLYTDKVLNCISAIDFCSQYPSNMCGILPDFNTAKEIAGTLSPTKEYPFAFYLKSGHVAEYNRFDTHSWCNNRFVERLFRFSQDPILNPTEDVTILMRSSRYELTDVYQHYYNLRKENETAKLVMNASIGYMHTKSYAHYRLAHLVAVSIARSNQRMLDQIETIGYRNILHICVDGAIYLGKDIYGNFEKKLNNLYQEFTACSGIISAPNKYIINDGTKFIKCKHSAFDKFADGSKMPEDELELCNYIKSFQDIFTWKATSKLEVNDEEK